MVDGNPRARALGNLESRLARTVVSDLLRLMPSDGRRSSLPRSVLDKIVLLVVDLFISDVDLCGGGVWPSGAWYVPGGTRNDPAVGRRGRPAQGGTSEVVGSGHGSLELRHPNTPCSLPGFLGVVQDAENRPGRPGGKFAGRARRFTSCV